MSTWLDEIDAAAAALRDGDRIDLPVGHVRQLVAVARAAIEALDQVRGPAETNLRAALAPLLEEAPAA